MKQGHSNDCRDFYLPAKLFCQALADYPACSLALIVFATFVQLNGVQAHANACSLAGVQSICIIAEDQISAVHFCHTPHWLSCSLQC